MFYASAPASESAKGLFILAAFSKTKMRSRIFIVITELMSKVKFRFPLQCSVDIFGS